MMHFPFFFCTPKTQDHILTRLHKICNTYSLSQNLALSQYQQIRQIHNHTMKYSPSLPMSHCRSLLHQVQKHLQALDLPSVRMFSAQIQLLVAWWHRRCSGITNCFNMSTKKRLVSGGGMFKMAQNFSIAAFPLPIE